MNTWKELNSSLPEHISEAAREEIRRATAARRHDERVAAALTAAVTWLRETGATLAVEASCRSLDELEKLAEEACARALCWAEGRGLYGGGRANPGAGTTRHPAFRNCGSGRRNAGDGPAWTAAIKTAAWADGLCSSGLDGKGQPASAWRTGELGFSSEPRPKAEGLAVGHEFIVPWRTLDGFLTPQEATVLYRGLLQEHALLEREPALLGVIAERIHEALRWCPWTDPAHRMICDNRRGPCDEAPKEPCCYCKQEIDS